LQADPFPMPAESGIRVLLISGAETGGGANPHAAGTAGAIATESLPAAAPPAVAPLPMAPSTPVSTVGVRAVQAAVVSLTILAFVIVATQQWRRRGR
ncbi:MAG: hypothetical protein ABI665_14055, partial [Vicinamibacterales bacterium]